MQAKEYVGIDLHRRRSVIVRRSSESETLEATRVDNVDLAAFERAVMAAGEHPEVVVEACYGWYWAVDWLEERVDERDPGNPSVGNGQLRRERAAHREPDDPDRPASRL